MPLPGFEDFVDLSEFLDGYAVAESKTDGDICLVDLTGTVIKRFANPDGLYVRSLFSDQHTYYVLLEAGSTGNTMWLDTETGELLPMKPETVGPWRDGMLKFQVDHPGDIPSRYGFLDSTLRPAIPAQYLDATNFYSGLAVVETEEGYGVIDTEGETVVPFVYESLTGFDDRGHAIGRTKAGGQWQLIDRTGAVLTELPSEGNMSYDLEGDFIHSKEYYHFAYMDTYFGETHLSPHEVTYYQLLDLDGRLLVGGGLYGWGYGADDGTALLEGRDEHYYLYQPPQI